MAISCKTLKAIGTICEYSASGVVELYIANWSKDAKITASNVTLGGTDKFYQIEVPAETASYTDNLQVSGAARSKIHSVSFGISKVTPDLADMIDTLALGKFIVVARTADGTFTVLGGGNGLQATEMSNASGTAATDEKGISVTLSGAQVESAIILDETGVEAFKALVIAPSADEESK